MVDLHISMFIADLPMVPHRAQQAKAKPVLPYLSPQLLSCLLGLVGFSLIGGCAQSDSASSFAPELTRGTTVKVNLEHVPIFSPSEDRPGWLAANGETLNQGLMIKVDGPAALLPIAPSGNEVEVVPIDLGDEPRYVTRKSLKPTSQL